MEKTTWHCDCGCGKSARNKKEKENWFLLSQPIKRKTSPNLKLNKIFRFYNIECLTRWATRIAMFNRNLLKRFHEEANSKKRITDPNLKEIYV